MIKSPAFRLIGINEVTLTRFEVIAAGTGVPRKAVQGDGLSIQVQAVTVHLEAGELAPWAASVIAPLMAQVVCSHPQNNAWIPKDADKSDRIDAYKLAELRRLNRFKEVHYASDQRRREFKTQWIGPHRTANLMASPTGP